jgi:predicted dehydrogenase
LFGSKAWAELRDDRRFVFQPRDGEREEILLPAVDAERLEVEAFGSAIRGDIAFPVSVADAVASVAALEAISRSADEQRVVKPSMA